MTALKQDHIDELHSQIAALEAEFAEMGEFAPQADADRLKKLRERYDAQVKNRASLQGRLQRLQRAAKRDRPSHEALTVEIPKWRTVILLALNSGALVPVLGNDKLPPAVLQASSVAFLSGAFAALLAGSLLDHIGRAGLEYADELEQVDLDLHPSPKDGLALAEKAVTRRNQVSVAADVSRFVSLLLFALGVVILAFRPIPPQTTTASPSGPTPSPPAAAAPPAGSVSLTVPAATRPGD